VSPIPTHGSNSDASHLEPGPSLRRSLRISAKNIGNKTEPLATMKSTQLLNTQQRSILIFEYAIWNSLIINFRIVDC